QEVVAAGEHHRAVDQHQVAPVGGLEDLDVLERRVHLVELAGDAVADRRAGRLEILVVPLSVSVHSCSAVWATRARREGPRIVAKPARSTRDRPLTGRTRGCG